MNFDIMAKKDALIKNLIIAGAQLLAFIFWFTSCVSIGEGDFSVTITASEYLKGNDLGFLNVFYVLFSIIGMICIVGSTFVDCIPGPAILRSKLMGFILSIPTAIAMIIQLLGVLLCYFDAKNTFDKYASITFTGVLSLIAVIAVLVLDSMFRKKKASANA